MRSRLRGVAIALVAVGLVFLGAALLQPSKDPAPKDLRDRFTITATVDRVLHHATALCEGDISGTGYLADKHAAFEACTFDKVVSIHQYLQHRATCADVIADAAALPDRRLGTATISGIYFDAPLTLHLDAVNGNACDRAAWKLLGPLLPLT